MKYCCGEVRKRCRMGTANVNSISGLRIILLDGCEFAVQEENTLDFSAAE